VSKKATYIVENPRVTPEIVVPSIFLFLFLEEVIAENLEEDFICQICNRKFKTEEKLRLHEELSSLHKVNIENFIF
jgi:hypothetical protein